MLINKLVSKSKNIQKEGHKKVIILKIPNANASSGGNDSFSPDKVK